MGKLKLAEAEEFWKCADENGDGSLTVVELRHAVVKYCRAKGRPAPDNNCVIVSCFLFHPYMIMLPCIDRVRVSPFIFIGKLYMIALPFISNLRTVTLPYNSYSATLRQQTLQTMYNSVTVHQQTMYNSVTVHQQTMYNSVTVHQQTMYNSITVHQQTMYNSVTVHQQTMYNSGTLYSLNYMYFRQSFYFKCIFLHKLVSSSHPFHFCILNKCKIELSFYSASYSHIQGYEPWPVRFII